jgi:hypothetical protein
MENHIVLQIDRNISDATVYVRVAKCERVAEYEAECRAIYPEWKPEGIHPFFNAARWHDRLVADMRYKRFKSCSLETVAPGLWSVGKEINEEEIVQFVDKKITSYFEDIADNAPMMERLCNFMDEGVRPTDYVRKDGDGNIDIPSMERNMDGEYVPTLNEMFSFIIFAIQSIVFPVCLDNTKKPLEPELQEVAMEICEVTGNVILSKQMFTPPEVTYIVAKTLGWDCKTPFNVFARKIIDSIYYQRFLTQVSGFRGVATSTTLPFDTVLDDAIVNAYDPSAMNLYNVTDFIEAPVTHFKSTIDFSKPVSDNIVAMEPPPKPEQCILYKNIITGNIQKLHIEIRSLTELESISDVDYKTSFGEYLFQHLHDVTRENLKAVIDDLNKFTDILGLIYKEAPTSTNRQRELTRVFVEDYKNDKADTPAYVVIDAVTRFLKKFIDVASINQQQISMDLLEFGVYKTRKSRGNVYGIRSPDNSELDVTCKKVRGV